MLAIGQQATPQGAPCHASRARFWAHGSPGGCPMVCCHVQCPRVTDGPCPTGVGGARARPAPEKLGSHFLILG
eukprot:1859308-Prymnesium_polylepis.2